MSPQNDFLSFLPDFNNDSLEQQNDSDPLNIEKEFKKVFERAEQTRGDETSVHSPDIPFQQNYLMTNPNYQQFGGSQLPNPQTTYIMVPIFVNVLPTNTMAHSEQQINTRKPLEYNEIKRQQKANLDIPPRGNVLFERLYIDLIDIPSSYLHINVWWSSSRNETPVKLAVANLSFCKVGKHSLKRLEPKQLKAEFSKRNLMPNNKKNKPYSGGTFHFEIGGKLCRISSTNFDDEKEYPSLIEYKENVLKIVLPNNSEKKSQKHYDNKKLFPEIIFEAAL